MRNCGLFHTKELLVSSAVRSGGERENDERGVSRNKGMEHWGWSDTSPERVRVRRQINRDGSAKSCTTEISPAAQWASIRPVVSLHLHLWQKRQKCILRLECLNFLLRGGLRGAVTRTETSLV